MFKETNFSKNIFFGFFHKVFFCEIFYCVAELFTETWYSLMLKQNIGIVNDVIFSWCYVHVHENNTFGNFDSFSDSFSKFALREFQKDPFTLELIDHYMMLKVFKVQNENLLKKRVVRTPPQVWNFPHLFSLFWRVPLLILPPSRANICSQMYGQ